MPKVIYYFHNDEGRIVVTIGSEDIGTWTTLEETVRWIRKYRPDIGEFELRDRKTMKLSSQSRWYLNGSWPVSVKPSVGNPAPEPSALQELVDAGLAEHREGFPGDRWELTAAGRRVKYA